MGWGGGALEAAVMALRAWWAWAWPGVRRADYLDLHAEGPVKWREEIFRGIRCSAKVVCFIDGEYLKSFNCLQASKKAS